MLSWAKAGIFIKEILIPFFSRDQHSQQDT
jgi:hypothetical protein